MKKESFVKTIYEFKLNFDFFLIFYIISWLETVTLNGNTMQQKLQEIQELFCLQIGATERPPEMWSRLM